MKFVFAFMVMMAIAMILTVSSQCDPDLTEEDKSEADDNDVSLFSLISIFVKAFLKALGL